MVELTEGQEEVRLNPEAVPFMPTTLKLAPTDDTLGSEAGPTSDPVPQGGEDTSELSRPESQQPGNLPDSSPIIAINKKIGNTGAGEREESNKNGNAGESTGPDAVPPHEIQVASTDIENEGGKPEVQVTISGEEAVNVAEKEQAVEISQLKEETPQAQLETPLSEENNAEPAANAPQPKVENKSEKEPTHAEVEITKTVETTQPKKETATTSEVETKQPEVEATKQEIETKQSESGATQQELKIKQQSEGETRQPEVEVANPEVEIANPEVEIAHSEVEITKLEVNQSEKEIKQPEEETKQTEVETKQPYVGTTKPEVISMQTEVETSQPEVETSQPEVETSQPEVETSQPEVESAQPDVETTQLPVATEQSEKETKQPEVETKQPNVETTQQEIETTQNKEETEQPEVETAEPPVETTQPEEETIQSEVKNTLAATETIQSKVDTQPEAETKHIEENIQPIDFETPKEEGESSSVEETTQANVEIPEVKENAVKPGEVKEGTEQVPVNLNNTKVSDISNDQNKDEEQVKDLNSKSDEKELKSPAIVAIATAELTASKDQTSEPTVDKQVDKPEGCHAKNEGPVTVPRRSKNVSESKTDKQRDSYAATKEEIEESLNFIKSKMSSTPPVPPSKAKRQSVLDQAEPKVEKTADPAVPAEIDEIPGYEPVGTNTEPLYELIGEKEKSSETDQQLPKQVEIIRTSEEVSKQEFSKECIPPVRPTRSKKKENLDVPAWSPPKQNIFSYLFSCFKSKSE